MADEAQEIILMGDSAGGGIALALSITVNEENIGPKTFKNNLAVSLAGYINGR